ncbi:prolyl oligopeptidase family serine peptidase [Anditalea andensis]|uniref:prolyl oligopeptidase n=1 Tax=Anditalea andensis TaxID=1048983 RepID=A0A074KXT0_9BACT|nr:prolyl oligopeptidase family serine peptidase [Anditalea andensis]KEO73015.1 prolyl endopeptidase [Anditalea andensis]
MNKKIILSAAACLTMTAGAYAQMDMKLSYPSTFKSDHVDEYWNEKVPDPYRWLEDDNAEETKSWVKEQNKLTFDYLSKISFRDQIREQLQEVWNYEKVSAPTRYGEYTYFSKNDGLQNQSILYRKKGENGKEEVFLDPNKLSEDGSSSLGGAGFTKDGSLFAYAVSVAGSDWRDIYVMDTKTKELKKDKIQDAKFTGIAWKGNEGFYYSTYEKPGGSKLSALTNNHKLYYHKLGTDQSEDKLIFGDDNDPRRYVGANVTEDQQYLIISAANSTTGNELYFQNLKDPNSKIVPLVKGMENTHYVIHSKDNSIFIFTNLNAPNNKIVKTDISKLAPENWTDLIPETENVLSPSTGGGKIFASYLKDAITEVKQFDLQGKEERTIKLPGVGTAGGFSAKQNEDHLYYSFTSYITPGTIYKYDIASGNSELYIKPDVKFNPDDYESKQVFFTSKDGTRVPMIITHKKGLELNGKNPTMLYAYGGFGVSLTPSFSVANTVWLDKGGIYAVPNLRGGGEYGDKWHKAGTKLQKQNVFDDFIAAAEYLISQNYTSSDYLAISGGSNGGLLVGATMTQRPELAKVAFPAVGVMDMLRYHQFTAGAGWAYDYGTADDSEEMYRYLKKYSPVHNLTPGVAYPATMVTTADHDDRVVPAHSFKFASHLQDAHAGDQPVLIRIETNAGHGAGKPTSKIIDEVADKFSFAWYNMGVDPTK